MDEFIRLNPNQMALMRVLIAIGPSTTYAMYQRMKEESILVKVASITMIYPILDSLIKKGLAEIYETKIHGEQERKKYVVTGKGEKVFAENQKAYEELSRPVLRPATAGGYA